MGGQRDQAAYWEQARDAKIADYLKLLKIPALIIQCTKDEYVDVDNRTAIAKNAQNNHQVVTYEGYSHSSWSYDQANEIIARSIDFIVTAFDEATP